MLGEVLKGWSHFYFTIISFTILFQKQQEKKNKKQKQKNSSFGKTYSWNNKNGLKLSIC